VAGQKRIVKSPAKAIALALGGIVVLLGAAGVALLRAAKGLG
jgi:LPS O-antigen subunit length determinant protein (WzzB/FepE family)